jgi:sterol desaturase/sphingolipid hydroxylase (fatty acid hydroxylase superfamily)
MTPDSEGFIRLAVFVGVFIALAAAEMAWPYRQEFSRGKRWLSNISLSVLNTLVVRVLSLLLPVLPVAVAVMVDGEGVLGALAMPAIVTGVAGFLLLDLAVYMQHVVFHHVPWFWRLHRVHHADTQFDVTTAIRFHPVEILLSLVWKVAVIITFGIPALAVLVFEIVLNASAMFSHANVRLPVSLDRVLRAIVVTPDMHRVHHSVVPREINTNFGFNLSVWDRLFGTYLQETKQDARVMPFGLPSYQRPEASSLAWLLLFPFHRGKIL